MAERRGGELDRHAALSGFRAVARRLAAPLGGTSAIFRAEAVLEGISDVHPVIQADPFAGRGGAAEEGWFDSRRQSAADRASGPPPLQLDQLRRQGDASPSDPPADDLSAPVLRPRFTTADAGGRGTGAKGEFGRGESAPRSGSDPIALWAHAQGLRPRDTTLADESERRSLPDSSARAVAASQAHAEGGGPAVARYRDGTSPPPASEASAQAIDLLRAAFARMDQEAAAHTTSAAARRTLAGQGAPRTANDFGPFEAQRARSGALWALARQQPPAGDSLAASGGAVDHYSGTAASRSAPRFPGSDLTEGRSSSEFRQRARSRSHRPQPELSTIARLDSLLRGSTLGGEQLAGWVALPGARPLRQDIPRERSSSSTLAMRPEQISAPSPADAVDRRDRRPALRELATGRELRSANTPAPPASAAERPRGESRIDSETLIDLVNEALIRQARRNGVDLI